MRLWLLRAMLFCSGASSLILQIIWLRGFALVFGSTVYSLSCVLTAFMLGLAVGSFGIGRVLRHDGPLRRNPLLAYGALELVAGLFALLLTPTLFLYQTEYLQWIGSLASPDQHWRMLGVHFVISSGLLLIPTACMGASLPLISLLPRHRAELPGLYGVNTIGAATGSLLASFWLIYQYGCFVAIYAACGINAALFVVALIAQRWVRPLEEQPAPRPVVEDAASQAPAAVRHDPVAIIALAVFSGFTLLSCEITWNRLLSLFLGNRIYVHSVTLSTILLCLALGARLSGVWVKRVNPYSLVATSYAIALISLACAFVFEPVALRLIMEAEPSALGRAVQVAFVLTMIVIPCIAMGVVFPTTLAVEARTEADSGAWLGAIYGANTLASVAGSLLAGYVLMDALGSNGIVLVNAGLLVVAVIYLLARHGATFGDRPRKLAVAAVASFVAVSIPMGMQPATLVGEDYAIYRSEDVHGIFTIVKLPPPESHPDLVRLRVLNNTTDLVFHFGSPVTQRVQETQGIAPALYAPKLERALNIGIGYGITLGALTQLEEFEAIEGVEIVPAIIHNSHFFHAGNYAYEKDPRIELHLTDGRHFLATSPHTYDLITINVSDPYLPGSASLFSDEFYRMAARKLTPGGVISQHIFGPDVPSLVGGLQRHFPHVIAVPSYSGSWTVIASAEPLEPRQAQRLRDRYDGGRKLFGHLEGLNTIDELLAQIDEGTARLNKLLAASPDRFVNTDVHPVLEFRRLEGKLFFSQH